MLFNMLGGKKLITTLDFTAGDMKLDYSANAMCFDTNASPQDLSTYAGAGTASCLLNFFAGDVLVASAYAGAVGGGESLGSEEFTDPAFDSATPPGTTWVIAYEGDWDISVTNAGKATALGTGTNSIIREALSPTVGTLYKLTIVCDSLASGKYRGYIAGRYLDYSFSTSPGTVNYYGTATSATGNSGICGSDNLAATFTDISLKALADAPATGLRLYKDRTLATRGAITGPGDLSVNAITSVKVFQA